MPRVRLLRRQRRENRHLRGHRRRHRDRRAALQRRRRRPTRAGGHLSVPEFRKQGIATELIRRVLFYDYAHGIEDGDEHAMEIARNDLDQYTVDIAELLSGANPNLPMDTVQAVFAGHVETMLAAIDGQAEGSEASEYEAAWHAASHIKGGADALAGAIAMQFPDMFAGEADENGADSEEMSATDLRVAVNLILQEHVYLTLDATEEIIETETDEEFQQAEATLDMRNTVPLSDFVGSVYDDEARTAFIELWRSHIGFFFDYSHGVEENDEQAMEDARANLAGYVEDIAALLSGANPNLTEEAVMMVFEGHVDTMLAAMDAQGNGPDEGGDSNEYYKSWKAAEHISGGADALAGAIAMQFPDMFDGGTEE